MVTLSHTIPALPVRDAARDFRTRADALAYGGSVSASGQTSHALEGRAAACHAGGACAC